MTSCCPDWSGMRNARDRGELPVHCTPVEDCFCPQSRVVPLCWMELTYVCVAEQILGAKDSGCWVL